MSALTDEHVHEVCRIGQGRRCCRFLTAGPGGFGCEKHTGLAETINQRVRAGLFTAQGDNCSGMTDAR